MKKLILSALLLSIVSCTAPELETKQQLQSNCGTIVNMGDTPTVDYIDVRMDYQNANQKTRFQVSNIYDYDLNQKICNFDGLKQIAY